MDTSKVTRVEVIDHTKGFLEGGRVYTYWSEYNTDDDVFGDPDIPNPTVFVQLQDDNRTLKIFIGPAPTDTPVKE